jgi:indole-3-glycerol phosphate synthase
MGPCPLGRRHRSRGEPRASRTSTISAVSGSRHLSQAISEGERISVLVEVRDGEAARAAAEHGATGVVLRGLADGLADRPDLPVLVYGPSARDAAEIGADAVVLGVDGDDDVLGELVHQAAALGLECVVRVGDEDELQRALELLDPEIVLLVAEGADDDEAPLDRLLALLPDVPAGKLAIAELAGALHDDVQELERAGVDAVLVSDTDVRSLVTESPPDV